MPSAVPKGSTTRSTSASASMSTRPNGGAAADQHGRPDVRAAVEQAEDADQGQGGRRQAGGKLEGRSDRIEQLGQSTCRQQEHRDTDEHRQRSPEAGKDPQEPDVPFHSADENVKLDAGGDVLAGGHRELESSTVGDTGGHRHVQRLMQQLGAAAIALGAGLGPRFTASAAVAAGAVHRNIERDGRAGARLLIGQTDGRCSVAWDARRRGRRGECARARRRLTESRWRLRRQSSSHRDGPRPP